MSSNKLLTKLMTRIGPTTHNFPLPITFQMPRQQATSLWSCYKKSNHLLIIGWKTSQSICFFLHDRTVGLSLNLCICFKEEVLKWLGIWISDNFLRFSKCIFQNLIFILDPMLSPYWWHEWLSWTNKRKRKIYFINILLVPS